MVISSPTDETVAGTSDGESLRARRADDEALREGEKVGRYVVLSRLGAGAMGVVYAAYDPELDRKIALKVLRGCGSAGEQSRLVREAQALAKLAHANVVVVHDAGTHEGRVWLAMELVPGCTLSTWLRERPRSWREVLDVIVPAGRGLAAAHAAGLVHRDFKPDNVMIGEGGMVRVMDFGLAVATQRAVTTARSGTRSAGELELEPDATRGTGIVGTPGYMAPEQLEGGEVGHPADQFSYAVALWEALFDERPFAGTSLAALAGSVLRGEIREPTRARAVPPWLRRIVRRGLALDARARWPSLDELLAEIERGRSRAGARRLALAASPLVLAGLGAYGVDRFERVQAERECETQAAAVAQVWNDTVRVRVRTAFAATKTAYAATGADKLAQALDGWVAEWSRTSAEACRAAAVHETWSQSTYEVAQACLHDRLAEVDALVQLAIGGSDAQVVVRATAAAAALVPPTECANSSWLARWPQPPPEATEQVEELRVRLRLAAALRSGGRYDEGLAAAREVVADAEALGWAPLSAQARMVEGNLLDDAGEYAACEAAFEAAVFFAAEAGEDALAAEAASHLVYVTGFHFQRSADALRWARLSRVWMARAGTGDGLVAAELASALGGVHQASGAYLDAIAVNLDALAIYERELGPGHLRITGPLNNLGNAHTARGEYEQARAYFARVHASRVEVLGENHPSVASALNNLANVDLACGDFAAAREKYERVLALREQVLGPDHPDVAVTLNNLGAVMHNLGDDQAAIEHHERSARIVERVYGPEHAQVGMSLANLGTAYYSLGRNREALEALQRSLTLFERASGPGHSTVGTILANLGNVHYTIGSYALALEHFERALDIFDASVTPGQVDRLIALQGAGDALASLGRPSEATRYLEQVLAERLGPDTPPLDRATTELALARALWRSGRDRDRAAALAVAAAGRVDRAADQERALADEAESLAREIGGRPK